MAKFARYHRYEVFGIFKVFVAMHPSIVLVGLVKSQVHQPYGLCRVVYTELCCNIFADSVWNMWWFV